jgi:hypothetical protein
MKVLYLEDSANSFKNIEDFNRGEFQIDFVNTVTALDEVLYEMEEYKNYCAVVMDLSIDMPFLTKENIVRRIPELDRKDVPTTCTEQYIPLYGLDYYKHVIAKRSQTQKMVEEGRIILFTGHASRIKSRGLYSEKDPLFENTRLIDRAEENATGKLFSILRELK